MYIRTAFFMENLFFSFPVDAAPAAVKLVPIFIDIHLVYPQKYNNNYKNSNRYHAEERITCPVVRV